MAKGIYTESRLPNNILVGHAAQVVHAAKNTIRMAALTGRLRSNETPWGLTVNTMDLVTTYVPRDNFTVHQNYVTWTPPTEEK